MILKSKCHKKKTTKVLVCDVLTEITVKFPKRSTKFKLLYKEHNINKYIIIYFVIQRFSVLKDSYDIGHQN